MSKEDKKGAREDKKLKSTKEKFKSDYQKSKESKSVVTPLTIKKPK